jgi:hypothetical protein
LAKALAIKPVNPAIVGAPDTVRLRDAVEEIPYHDGGIKGLSIQDCRWGGLVENEAFLKQTDGPGWLLPIHLNTARNRMPVPSHELAHGCPQANLR